MQVGLHNENIGKEVYKKTLRKMLEKTNSTVITVVSMSAKIYKKRNLPVVKRVNTRGHFGR